MTRTASGASARLPLTVALTFAVAYLPLQALQVAGAVYLPAYFATMGIGLVAVGTAFGIVRLIDVPIEFVLGVSMDRTRTRFGRYRIWLAAGAPLFMLGLYMLLRAGPAGGMAYLIVWLLVMYLGVSIMMLAHQAWTATLAKSYAERARLFGVILGVGISGAVSVLAIPIVMEELGRTDAEGVRAMMWYLIGITPFAIGLALWRTPETITPDEPGQRFRWRDYLDLVLDRNMLRILLADLSLSLGPTWMSALYIFFSRDVMGFTAGQAGILLLVYIMAGVAGAPTLGWLATKISKHRTVMLAAASYSLLLMTLPFLPKGVLLAALPTLFLTGFMAAGFNVLTRAMTADVADEMRLRQGKERSGLLYALTTLTTKLAGGVSVLITLPAVAAVGYDPALRDANTPQAARALEIAFLAGPVFFVMLGAACLIGYRLTAERAAEVRRQLEVRAAAPDPAAGLEGLTGEELAPPRPSR